MLELGWLYGGTPVSSEQEEYEDFIESRKKKAQTMPQTPPPVSMVLLVVPTPSTPFLPPEISRLIYHASGFSNMQVGHAAYLGILVTGAMVFQLVLTRVNVIA